MLDERGVIVIDLGTERGEPDSYVHRRRETMRPWTPVALLAAVVLMLTGASAAPARSPLTTVFTLAVGPADSYAVTAEGDLLAQTVGQLSAYDLVTGEMRWQSGQIAPAYRLRVVDGLILMRPWLTGRRDPGTSAVSVYTGVPRWQRPGSVVTVAGSSALLSVTPSRSMAGANRRVEGPIEAIDPLDGATRWTVPVATSGVVTGVPGPGDSGSRMLVVSADRTMALHDLDTGERLASRQVPAADYDAANPAVTGGFVLLRHPGDDGMRITAYEPVTLRALWSRPAYDAYRITACGVLACLIGAKGVRAVDPATGDERWNRPGWRDVDVRGTSYVAYSAADDVDPIGIIDPDTGAVQVDLTGWQPVEGADNSTGGDGTDSLLVTRTVEPGNRTMIAVARPGGGPEPRLLTDLPAGTGDCQSAAGCLVCRTMTGELVVWAYREG